MLNRLKTWMRAEEVQAPRLPWRIFWVGLALRLLYMTLARLWHLRPYDDHFGYGWEAGRIARSLVQGYGYSSPFRGHTGPTAWLPPLYPLLMAAVFKLTGVYTALSAWILLAIDCTFNAFTALAVWEIGRRMVSRANAVYAAWLWALYPASMQYAVKWLWEMSITCCLVAWMFVIALRLRGVNADGEGAESLSPTALWLGFGALWGAIAMSNSSVLILLPAAGLWILAGTWRRPHEARNAVLAGIIFLAAVAPWEARNAAVFHRFIPFRANLGAEAALGNGPGATGLLMEYNHPNQSTEQLKLYAAMGEVRYAAMRGELANRTIQSNRMLFYRNVFRRMAMFWCGVPQGGPWYSEGPRLFNFCLITTCGLLGLALALYRRVAGAWLMLWAFVLTPIPYYLVTVHARFRHPLEPMIAVLTVFLFQSAERG